MRNPVRVSILAALTITTLMYFACSESQPGKGVSNPMVEAIRQWQKGRSRQILQGAELYQRHCAICHGENAGGNGFNAYLLDPKPADLIPLAIAQNREHVLKVIAGGSAAIGKSPLCPPLGKLLTAGQRESIFDYLNSSIEKSKPE